MDDWYQASVVAAILSGIAAAWVFWQWMATRHIDGPERVFGLVTLLLFPYGFFVLGVPYSEGLFLAFAIGAFLSTESDHLGLAGLLAAAAAATRFAGVVLVPALLVCVAENRSVLSAPSGKGLAARWRFPIRFDRSRLEWRHLFPLTGLAGTVAYFGYSAACCSAPFGYFTSQSRRTNFLPKIWHPLVFSHSAIVVPFSELAKYPKSLAVILGDGVAVILFAIAIPFVGRKFGWGYATYTLGIVLLIWFASWDFASAGRYLLAAFPVFALAGTKLGSRRGLWPLVAASGALMILLSIAFITADTFGSY